MTTDLTNPIQDQPMSMVHANADASILDSLSKGADFFARLQLMTANSSLAQEEKVPAGSYALVVSKQDVRNLGNEVDLLVCGVRVKAMHILSDEQIITIYNPQNPEFSRIRQESEVKDSGCLCGLEFLVWIPDNKNFATFYCANKSHRQIASPLRACMESGAPGPATLKSSLVKKKQYKWHAPQVAPCLTAFALPEQDALVEAMTKFMDTKDTQVESVGEGTAQSSRER